MKVICEYAIGAALTWNKEYDATPAFNRDYYRIVDDNGKLDSFRTTRFRPAAQQVSRRAM